MLYISIFYILACKKTRMVTFGYLEINKYHVFGHNTMHHVFLNQSCNHIQVWW